MLESLGLNKKKGGEEAEEDVDDQEEGKDEIRGEIDNYDDEEDMADFLVDDEGEEGEGGYAAEERRARPAPERRRREGGIRAGPSSDQIREAVEVFGDDLAHYLDMTENENVGYIDDSFEDAEEVKYYDFS